MTYKPPAYKMSQTAKKGLQMGATGGIAAALAIWVIGQLRAHQPDMIWWPPEQDEMAIATIMAVAVSVTRMVQNWAKNGQSLLAGATGTIIRKIGLGAVLVSVAIGMNGCATATPALGGKTKAEQRFEETTAAVIDPETGEVISPSTTTMWSNKWEAGAGADLAAVAGLQYSADADQSWDLNISGDATADTSKQAEALVNIAQMQLEAFKMGVSTAGGLATAALPLAQTAIEGSNERRMYRLQNPGTSKFELVLELLRDQEIRDWLTTVPDWTPPTAPPQR